MLGNKSHIATLLLALALFTGQVNGQEFTKEILLDGLSQPTGITVDLVGNLYYTEVPEPGVAGGANTVNRYRVRTGQTTTISEGEPYPTNLAVNFSGTLYWTCQTAGVILQSKRRGNGPISVALDGLETPVGIDVPLFARRSFLFTQIPTPGVPGSDGGRNEVDFATRFLGRTFVRPISEGEPEPSDVAVGLNGTVYWTCKTAGVILKRDLSGTVSLVKDGLNSPVGLDVDFFGRLYWTEVPTPGVPGTQGGKNRVVRYSPRSGNLTVISEGEPEPVDVTTNWFGDKVYWTCRTAGVIIRATE